MVRTAPWRSQRRPEVSTRSGRHSGLPATALSRREIAMSSISGSDGKPPISSNSARATNIPWSPVAMPVSRERRFIIFATTGRSGERPSIATSNRPQRRPAPEKAAARRRSASAETRVSACRNTRRSPPATRAPAFICVARPRSLSTTRSASAAATSRVASLLPPSATMISCPASRSGCSGVSVAGSAAASFSVGTMIDRRIRAPAAAALRRGGGRAGPGAGRTCRADQTRPASPARRGPAASRCVPASARGSRTRTCRG